MLEKSVDFLLIVPEIKKLLALSDVVGGDSTQDRCTCRHLGKEVFFTSEEWDKEVKAKVENAAKTTRSFKEIES